MLQIAVETQKPKRSQRRPWGCLMLLAIPFVLCAACHGAMWVLARYGGEWVAQQDMPLPPGSQEVHISVSEYREDYGFICHLRVYLYDGGREELRDWFIDHEVTLTPILISAERNVYSDHEDYDSNFLDFYNWPLLHYLYVWSVYRFTDYYDDQAPPHRLRIYKTRESFLKYYPTIDLPNGMSTFDVGLCRHDFSQYGFN